MAKIPDPQTQEWRGQNIGMFKGDFNESYCINLESNPGTLMSSQPLKVINDRTAINYGAAVGFLSSDADGVLKYWAGTTDADNIKTMLNTTDFNVSSFLQDSLASTPTTSIEDIIIHGKYGGYDRMVVATAGNLLILNSSLAANAWRTNWWTGDLGKSALSSGVRLAKLNKLLVVCDDYQVHTIDEDDIVNYGRLKFQTNYTIVQCMVSLDRFWFGLKNDQTGQSAIAEWDGFSSTYNNIYYVNFVPFTGFVIRNTPYYVLNNGQIVKFNGSGFEEKQKFPVYESNALLLYSNSQHSTFVEGDIVYINIGSTTYSSKMRPGVWVYDSVKENLYHSYGWKVAFGYSSSSPYGGSFGYAIFPTFDFNKFLVSYGAYKNVGTSVVDDKIISTIDSWSNNKSSYIVTSLIKSSEVEDHWYNIWAKIRKLQSESNFLNDKIIVKYRVSNGTSYPSGNYYSPPKLKTISWTSATKFTVSSLGSMVVGTEVFILYGPSCGTSFHISNINTLTKEITIDETPFYTPLSGQNGSIIYDDWIKITGNTKNTNPITPLTWSNQTHLIVDDAKKASGPYVQFKIEMRGFNTFEIYQLIVDSKSQTVTNL